MNLPAREKMFSILRMTERKPDFFKSKEFLKRHLKRMAFAFTSRIGNAYPHSNAP